MSDKHLINHLQKQPLHQGKAVPSHISTQPDPSNITGHKVLIFHSIEYHLAVNRIYTRLSMFQGGLPSPHSTAGIFSPSQECTLETWRPLAPVVTFYLREKTWKLTIQAKMKFVLAAIWTQTKSSRGESEAVSLSFPPRSCKVIDNRDYWIIYHSVETCPPSVSIIYYRYRCNKCNL